MSKKLGFGLIMLIVFTAIFVDARNKGCVDSEYFNVLLKVFPCSIF